MNQLMNQIFQPTNRGVDVILSINGKILGGQKSATLTRTMSPISITNKINGEWAENIAGTKSWNLNCSGMFIKNEESFNLLETAFYNNLTVEIKMSDGNISYVGKGLITSFPATASYGDSFTYTVKIIGTGPIEVG